MKKSQANQTKCASIQFLKPFHRPKAYSEQLLVKKAAAAEPVTEIASNTPRTSVPNPESSIKILEL